MKHQEFIALLNLYMDHEIAAPDVARLEAEVLANPGRRAIYIDYCRMQKACATLTERFRELAPAAPAEAAAVRPAPRRPWAPALYAAGLAAAACVVAVWTLRSRPAAAASAPIVAQAPAAAPSVGPAASAPSPALPGRSDALFVSAAGTPQLDWISQVHLDPVQRPLSTDQLFAFRNDLKPEAGSQPGARPLAPTEMTAFQVQK
jgi:hypothetical protein